MFKLKKEKIKNVLSQLSSNGNRMTGEIERHTAPDVSLVFLDHVLVYFVIIAILQVPFLAYNSPKTVWRPGWEGRGQKGRGGERRGQERRGGGREERKK